MFSINEQKIVYCSWLILRKWHFSINETFFAENILSFRNTIIVWFTCFWNWKYGFWKNMLSVCIFFNAIHFFLHSTAFFRSKPIYKKNVFQPGIYLNEDKWIAPFRLKKNLIRLKSEGIQPRAYRWERGLCGFVWQNKPRKSFQWITFIHWTNNMPKHHQHQLIVFFYVKKCRRMKKIFYKRYIRKRFDFTHK